MHHLQPHAFGLAEGVKGRCERSCVNGFCPREALAQSAALQQGRALSRRQSMASGLVVPARFRATPGCRRRLREALKGSRP